MHSSAYFPGIELRTTRGPDNAAFRKLLIELLQSALTQAKYHKNIEMDLLFRLTLLKFVIAEIGNQFANLILEGKEWIRQRGEHFERSQQAHVIKARLSELQSVPELMWRLSQPGLCSCAAIHEMLWERSNYLALLIER